MSPSPSFLLIALLAVPGLAFAADPAAATPPETTAAGQVSSVAGRAAGPATQTAPPEAPASPAKEESTLYDKLKFSGFVQGRYLWAEDSRSGAEDGASAVTDGFMVRRGRLKATYTGDWSKYVLQIDAVPRGVTLKDAEAWLIEPWTGHKLALVVGQMKWPFGYELEQSSRDRELPERSRAVRAMLFGERDRGAKITGTLGWFTFAAGVFNGSGTGTKARVGGEVVDFGTGDNDREKDLIGRLGFKTKAVSGGLSGWWGNTFNPDPDVRRYFNRDRLGADLQVTLPLLPFGKTALKAEYLWGHTWWKDGIEQYGVLASGWYALLVQDLGPRNVIAVRYDYFDPANGTPTASAADPTRPAATNAVGTLGAGFIHKWDSSLKISAFYELPMTATTGEVVDPADGLLTIQFQAAY